MSKFEKLNDKRRHLRHATLCFGKLIEGERELDCEVLDLSTGGAKLRVPEPLEVESQICLGIERVGRLSGRVAWCNGATLGVKFDEELPAVYEVVTGILSEGGDEKRHSVRTSLLSFGKLHSGDQAVKCRIVNISARGAQICCEDSFDCDLEVRLQVDGLGTFASTVVWQQGNVFGLVFKEEAEHVAQVLAVAFSSTRREAG